MNEFYFVLCGRIQYRDIAPESVDDEVLKVVIANAGSHHQIVLAIENMWHGE